MFIPDSLGTTQMLVLAIPAAIPAIMGIAGALRGLFGGGGGGKQRKLSEQSQRQQMEMMQKLFPQILKQLDLDRMLNMRRQLRTDPGLAPMFQAQFPGQASQISGFAAAGKPLERAVNDLAFGLLPRSARRGGEEAETKRRQAEAEAPAIQNQMIEDMRQQIQKRMQSGRFNPRPRGQGNSPFGMPF